MINLYQFFRGKEMSETSIVWQKGVYGGNFICGRCRSKENVRHSGNGKWALCDSCAGQGVMVVKVSDHYEYRSSVGTFSSPRHIPQESDADDNHAGGPV